MLELFAFVRPARFCLPTPRGLAASLGLARPARLADEAVVLAAAAHVLLGELTNAGEADDDAVGDMRPPRLVTVTTRIIPRSSNEASTEGTSDSWSFDPLPLRAGD